MSDNYAFQVVNERPNVTPLGRISKYDAIVDGRRATTSRNSRGRSRSGIAARVKKSGPAVRARVAISGGKVYVWCEPTVAEQHPLKAALADMSRRKLLLVDDHMRYSLAEKAKGGRA